MSKIEAIIRPQKLQEVQDALDKLGVSGLTITEVRGCGRQKGYREHYRGGRANISLLAKLKIEIVVGGELKDQAVAAIKAAAFTGEVGDGRIFVMPVAEAIRIRTDESGSETLKHMEPEGWGH